MIKFKKKIKKDINLTAMINIIFLLLIFFMLTGTIQMKQITLIEKPLSQYSTKDSHNDKNLLLISLDSNEDFYLNNELILIEELEKRIMKQNINQKIFLDLDKKSKIINLNKIIRVLKKKQFKNVYIRTISIND
tara:strand:- start:145 stop:546 length:402 start_codon:yes stop_codon:yes gene_type:complete